MSSGTTTTHSPETATRAKLCRKCGRDITHERRLKDAAGNYWCSDCGVDTDSAATGSALISPCPKCHAPTHAAHMIRKNGVYVCEACASGANSKRGRKRGSVHTETVGGSGLAAVAANATYARAPVDDETKRKRRLAFIGVAMILAGAAMFYLLNG